MAADANTEIEIKLQLDDESAWRRLCAGLGSATDEVLQINRFYDSAEGVLAAARLALRLRQEAGRYTLTLKGPKRMRGAAAARFEVEAPLELAAAEAALREPSSLLELDNEPLRALRQQAQPVALRQVLRFENLRRRYPRALAGQDLILEVDRTRFGDDSVDYELEVELAGGVAATTVAAVDAALRELLAAHGIAYRQQPEGKFSRALQRQGH